MGLKKINTANLRGLQIGVTEIFELDHPERIGATVTSICSKYDSGKIRTRKVFIIDPLSNQTVIALALCKIEELGKTKTKNSPRRKQGRLAGCNVNKDKIL